MHLIASIASASLFKLNLSNFFPLSETSHDSKLSSALFFKLLSTVQYSSGTKD